MPSLRSVAARLPFPLALLVLLVGCGSVAVTPPVPTAGDITGIATELTKRGLVLDRLVSGDAGCDDATLIPTAIGLDAKGLGQDDPVRLRLYIFRDRETMERLRASVDQCARAYVTDPESYVAIEQSPYVLTGIGPWPDGFETAVREALVGAAGSGN